jgi:2,3-bisphosphoglycerate-independent phosphoglycerate mutase
MRTAHGARGALQLAEAVQELYLQGQVDYYLEPIILADDNNQPIGRIQDGDAVVFCCRRGEREVQLTEAFTEPGFAHFTRPEFRNLTFVILTLYHEKFYSLPVAFAPARLPDTLGEVVSRAGLRQLRLSESEKFAHVTFFFNGGNNQPFPGEVDLCVPSVKGVPFDQIPELRLPQVCEQVLEGIASGYDLIVTNFANGDVIGHTQNNAAKVRCAEVVDAHLGRLVEAALAADVLVLVTADHGNLEQMITPQGTPDVSHTTNPVPFLLLDRRAPVSVVDGKLADIAPTILEALGCQKPASMSGTSLAPGHHWDRKRRVLLVILDGWGIGRSDAGNPIHLAHTPAWDALCHRYPVAQLQAAGEAVGLQPGKAGNSEAGHINLGAGRVVLQDDVRLDRAMQDGSFYSNPVLLAAIEKARQQGSRLHLIGLLTEKSSHGSIHYPLALLRMAREHGLEEAYLHLIFDGRSTEPGSAPALLEKLEAQVAEIGVGQVVTGMGRGIALDRDGNYAKTQRAFEALVQGAGRKVMAVGRAGR